MNAKGWCKNCRRIYKNNDNAFFKDFKSDIGYLAKYQHNDKIFKQYLVNLKGNLLYSQEIVNHLKKVNKEQNNTIRELSKRIRILEDMQNGFTPQRKPITKSIRHEVFVRDGYKCVECGATKEDTRLHVDHIIPVSQGGTDELSNFQTLCEACNLAKSNRAWVAGKYKKTTTITEEYQSRKKIDYSIMAEAKIRPFWD